jgi:peptidoglycan/LPS O-acetylase OafA/YrhL
VKHKNNFDFLRIVAALSVLISHVRPIHDNTFPLGYLGAFGVFTFFAMSGYLVSASWERDPNLIRFVSRRVLRIFPGLIAAIAIAAFVVGPLTTTLSTHEYFRSLALLLYLKSVFLYPMSFSLPGVFTGNPLKDNVNGSLWTLPMEVFMYAALVLMSLIAQRLRAAALPILATLLALSFGLEMRSASGIFLTMPTQDLARCSACFISGSILWHLRDRVKIPSWSWAPLLVLLVAAYGTHIEIWALLLLVPCAAISFATAPYTFVKDAGKFGDISYGLYIYAFLIQQTLMHFFPSIGVTQFFIASLLLSLVAGYLSWHLLEKRALKLKDALGLQSFTAAGAQ